MMDTAADAVRPEAAIQLHSWEALNRQWLVGAFARLRERIEASDGEPTEPVDCVQPSAIAGFTPALLICAKAFGLSPFERELLLLLAGIELDDALRQSVAKVAGGARPSFGLALGILTSPHWDALSPDAPLRRWRVIAPEPAAILSRAPLQLDERILHFIAGIGATDSALAGIATYVAPSETLEAEHVPLARRIVAALDAGSVAVLSGGNDAARRDWALAVSALRDRDVLWIDTRDLPSDAGALAQCACHLDREAALGVLTLVLLAEPGSEQRAVALAGRLATGLIWNGTSAAGLDATPRRKSALRFDLPDYDVAHASTRLLARWRLRNAGKSDGTVEAELVRAAQQFQLGSGAVDGFLERIDAAEAGRRAEAVWPAAREAVRGGLDAVAQRVASRAGFDDLVVPAGQAAMLRDIARQLRQRERVYRDWGFAEKYQLGQGLVALFSGESGTGKTLAAEAIATEAGLDLYRIDLASLVSKYIGETEKNLKRLFDAAEASGAVLLFDEADALFGKRSDVKDSHDRYANIEVAYLLQRVETYRGLAILTTNMKSALDRAFLRRIRFVVNFPMPDQAARERIWRRQFPAAAPLGTIDFTALARLNICGGNIRSIAVNAAFKAADAGTAIDQTLLMTAAHEEFAKLERSLGHSAGGAS
ncbi:ATP-binding protein [Mesorhizobium sp. BR1-1-16]|uniref:ATP-binding protein n=1 Tax=Mesorhizobium sp. BR1-1-16 TaxID=2876653 RepID=UPI001CCCE9FA|nr:ATP-binding protein [Mesorhizobium sp. BR1-1-16]MBZ9935657.1 ATP-binding protein [Mesorhizobium sp. BR1-1-16]